jgi:hypothetical protein
LKDFLVGEDSFLVDVTLVGRDFFQIMIIQSFFQNKYNMLEKDEKQGFAI